jgi:hypothetical protein
MRTASLCLLILFAGLPGYAQKGGHNPAGHSNAGVASNPSRQTMKATRNGLGVPRQNPGHDLERLQSMSAEQRKQALEGLPEGRQKQIAKRLNQLDKMDPAKRERLFDRYQQFQHLPPEKQELIREVGRQLQELPDDRRPIVRNTLNRLRQLPEEERLQRMNRPQFQERFSPGELDIIRRGIAIGPDTF